MTGLEHLKNKPNLFIIGAQKCGTTRLHYLLNQHPEIFMSEDKEPSLFHRPVPREGLVDYYLKQYENVGNTRWIGDASTVYTRSARLPGTAQRIFEFSPQARLIYMVRHPIRRMESGWIESHKHDRLASPDFNYDVHNAVDILDISLYWKQLEEYRRFYSDERIHVIFFEDFIKDEAKILKEIFDFLEVDSNFAIDTGNSTFRNESQGKTQARPFFYRMRRWSHYEKLRLILPRGIRQNLRKNMMQPIASRPQWKEATLQWALEQVRPDSAQLLEYARKEADFWDLSPVYNV